MPPKANPSAPGRGRGRGRGAPPRGTPPTRGAPVLRGGAPPVTTVGVRRPGHGTAGRRIQVYTNHYEVDIPDGLIYHYDVVIESRKRQLPARRNLQIIQALQKFTAPQVFVQPAAYDGKKNMFSPIELSFGERGEFEVEPEPAPANAAPDRPPRTYKVTLTKVAVINPETLHRFLQGAQSNDNTVLTAITALNVIVRTEPSLKHPFNVRSFFTSTETRDIGGCLSLWRGYFQSVRPGNGRMLMNLDISTGVMYKPGCLLDLCCEYVGRPGPQNRRLISPRQNLPDRERLRLQRFFTGVLIQTLDRTGQPSGSPRPLRGLSEQGAADFTFALRDGQTTTVANYFRQSRNQPLQFPDVLCAKVGDGGAAIPLEYCWVAPGQIMRKQVPAEKTSDVVTFSTMRPEQRLAAIKRGVNVLNYGQSEYLRSFRMKVNADANAEVLKADARVIPPIPIEYANRNTITPRFGAWNLIDKRFYRPATVQRWIIVIFEREAAFPRARVPQMVNVMLSVAKEVGITMNNPALAEQYGNAQAPIADQLRSLGKMCMDKTQQPPTLIVIVMPENSAALYQQIKHFGDIQQGVATQCMRARKCMGANKQYFANILLKVNVKLGGINSIPQKQSVPLLTDPANPTIVMGADVMHPPPEAQGRPSYAAVVANVDSDTAKYIADCRVQPGREEMILDLQAMCKNMLTKYMGYGRAIEKRPNSMPKRLIFYRGFPVDGVSEGQFQQVLDNELPAIKKACAELNINPKITLLVVGKRHHVRMFPVNERDGDRTGNCLPGTVIDRDVCHPIEFDFFLQSHAGLLGTSRPGHYNVLYNDNNFTPDDLQALTFALCHVYARATRSVSIPAPVYYADIVCARAKHHYAPTDQDLLSEIGTQTVNTDEANAALDIHKGKFKAVHANTSQVMYFS